MGPKLEEGPRWIEERGSGKEGSWSNNSRAESEFYLSD